MKTQREYRQTARAESVQQTRQSIVESLFDLAQDKLFTEISLKDVAAGSGVTVQTILRQFGSRATLFEEAIAFGVDLVRAERAVDPTDTRPALSVLMDHYELRGRMTLMMLAQETVDPAIAQVVEGGRVEHRNWVLATLAGPSATSSPSICWSSQPMSTRGNCCGSTAASRVNRRRYVCKRWSIA